MVAQVPFYAWDGPSGDIHRSFIDGWELGRSELRPKRLLSTNESIFGHDDAEVPQQP
jgi:hypothetical protein